jgi:hypothetical protein
MNLKCRGVKLEFAEKDNCKPDLFLKLSLAGNLEKPLRHLWDRMEPGGP